MSSWHCRLINTVFGLLFCTSNVFASDIRYKQEDEMQLVAAESSRRGGFHGYGDIVFRGQSKEDVYRIDEEKDWFPGKVDQEDKLIFSYQDVADVRAKKACKSLVDLDRACRPSKTLSLLKHVKSLKRVTKETDETEKQFEVKTSVVDIKDSKTIIELAASHLTSTTNKKTLSK